MIPLIVQIPVALLLDFLLGDPRWVPHPVKGIGWLALLIENPLRRLFSPRPAGLVAVFLVVTTSTSLAWCCCRLATTIHPLCGDLVSILLLYSCFAVQDLRQHALAVHNPLVAGDLELARKKVAMLVGRDTEKLDEKGITRATVESIAENTVDGVTAPLFFAFIAGVPGAVLYKTINTLDSTYGYKNEHYFHFGWAAARLDDLVNLIPARISALLVPPAAWLTGQNGRQAWQIFVRDRHKHPSPNGGQIEAAFAGALHIQLGGPISYGGEPSVRPYLGISQESTTRDKIQAALRLMLATSLFITACGVLMRLTTAYVLFP